MQDWQSPEVGEAIRIILDVFESIGLPKQETTARFQRLGKLVREQPEVAVAAYSAIIHSALELPALFPTTTDKIREVRKQIERKVYGDIDQMP